MVVKDNKIKCPNCGEETPEENFRYYVGKPKCPKCGKNLGNETAEITW